MAVSLNLKDIQSGFLSAATFNANNAAIEAAFTKTLNRTSNAVDNAMEVDLDMGLNRIFNLSDATVDNEAVNFSQVKNLITDASGIVVRLREDRKVAADGQQVFTMSSIKYVPGANTIQVYVNGVAQVSGIDYSEVDTTTISFYTGLNAGDVVDIYVNESTTNNISGEVRLSNTYESVADMVADPNVVIGSYVSTAGYYTPGDGGGNEYKIVAGGTGTADGGSFIDLDNGLQASGLFGGVINVRQFGAKGDETSDDTTAIQNAYNSIDSGYVCWPPGVYRKTAATTFNSKSIRTLGSTSGSSIVKCEASDAFSVDNSGLADKDQVVFAYLGIQTDSNGLYTGLTFTGQTGSALEQQLVLQHCSFTGIGNSSAWQIGISLIDADFSNVSENFFRGNTSDLTKMTSAINVNATTDSKFLANHIYWADVAINFSGFSEGNTVRDSHIVPCNVGVKHQASGNLLWVIDNHISAYTSGVLLGTSGVAEVNHCHVRGNLIFKNALSANNFSAIDVESKKCEISGNEVLIPGGASAGGAQNGVVIGATSSFCRVYGNQVANMDTAILIKSGAEDNIVSGNTFLSNANNIADSGTRTLKGSNQADNEIFGARVKITAPESIANATPQIIDWDSEDRDTHSIWSLGSPSRLTVPNGVKQVRVSCGIRWASNSTGERYVEIIKNGTDAAQGLSKDRRPSQSTSDVALSTSVMDVNPGDYFEVRVFQNSTASLDIQSAQATWFQLEII